MRYRYTVAAAAVLLLSAALSAADTPGPTVNPEEAVALYDAGRYEEARGMLEELDARSEATGPLLYRLAFALGKTGEAARGKAMESRAMTVLEQEFASGGGLEVAFYLSNAHRNTNNPTRSTEVAGEAIRRQESGTWPEPETALERFRIGKLYADQNREEEAAGWYRKALTGFEAQAGRFPSYENWIRRYLYRIASDQQDWKTAGELLRANLEGGQGSRADHDLLAVLLTRSGRWAEAEEAWRSLERMDPAQADRPRYCRQLTIRAREVGTLPVETLDGEPIASLDKDRMEVILKELADNLTAVQTGVAGDPDADREAAGRELDKIKPVFVAVALEYAYQGHPIRETAFQGGYAPLIFHASRWVVPNP
jgi:tetratricopeptide (TPR) repeat protein